MFDRFNRKINYLRVSGMKEAIKILSINISAHKGVSKTPVLEAIIDKKGIVGDAHYNFGQRQISLLSQESINKFKKESNLDIKYGEFAENLTISGIDLTKVKILDRFKIGQVVLEVTQIGKKCHGQKCHIYHNVGKCIMPKEGLFCRVITSGKISIESEVTCIPFQPKISVITLSDRAYNKIYEDLSGKKIVENVSEFFKEKKQNINLKKIIIPDNASKLKQIIRQQINQRYQVIFTTGGTGIGSRDITPDTIEPMLYKKIPGIMDYIRTTSAAKIPNAMISRSVAGTINKTLVFTLPGSQKAIDEYLEVIFLVLEHLILMVNDIDNH